MPFVKMGGMDFAYARWGDTESPAVLLLTGLGMPKEAWPPSLVGALVRQGFQVIVPDNRDAGASFRFEGWAPRQRDVFSAVFRTLLRMPVTGGYALEDMALDVERLLDALGVRRAHVVGISMGGMVAQVLAVQCPNRIASLVTIASASGNPRTGLGSLRAVWAVIAGGSPKTEEERRKRTERILRVLSGPAYPVEAPELREILARMPVLPFDQKAFFRQLIAILASGDRSGQLRNLRTPTLVVHGTRDPLLPLAAGREVASLVHGSELWEVEGLGHQVPEALVGELSARIAAHCHRHPA